MYRWVGYRYTVVGECFHGLVPPTLVTHRHGPTEGPVMAALRLGYSKLWDMAPGWGLGIRDNAKPRRSSTGVRGPTRCLWKAHQHDAAHPAAGGMGLDISRNFQGNLRKFPRKLSFSENILKSFWKFPKKFPKKISSQPWGRGGGRG